MLDCSLRVYRATGFFCGLALGSGRADSSHSRITFAKAHSDAALLRTADWCILVILCGFDPHTEAEGAFRLERGTVFREKTGFGNM